MTLNELYNWAKKEGLEDAELVVRYSDEKRIRDEYREIRFRTLSIFRDYKFHKNRFYL